MIPSRFHRQTHRHKRTHTHTHTHWTGFEIWSWFQRECSSKSELRSEGRKGQINRIRNCVNGNTVQQLVQHWTGTEINSSDWFGAGTHRWSTRVSWDVCKELRWAKLFKSPLPPCIEYIELHASLLASQQTVVGTIPCARRVRTHTHTHWWSRARTRTRTLTRAPLMEGDAAIKKYSCPVPIYLQICPMFWVCHNMLKTCRTMCLINFVGVWGAPALNQKCS